MSGNGQKTPERFQIKGYKYRAQMLIAGAALLIIVILLFSLIIHGISSAIKGAGKDKTSDSDVTSSETFSEIVSAVSSAAPTESSEASSSAAEVKKEKYDADGKLVIDTDTLDGKKAIAITFDDGPSEYTQQLIDGLNERGAKATFFMVGSNVAKYPEAVNAMVSGGHEIGNHTYNHIDIATSGAAKMNEEISQTDDAIFNVCGKKSTAFRPPYGSFTDDLINSLDKTVTLWSVDTLDWKNKDAKKIKKTIVSESQDGSIVLLHDLYKTSIDGALAAIDQLQSEGYVFVTVDELMTRYGYEVSPGAHNAQFAVYETNSPHASEYLNDVEKDKEKNTVSLTGGAFYYDKTESGSSDSTSAQTSSDKLVY